jgi:predicted DNA-binding protein (UPF0251 family)
MKVVAKALAAEQDGGGGPRWSQEQIGGMLGVSQQTVSGWLTPKTMRVTDAGNAHDPRPKRKKKRQKLNPEDAEAIWQAAQGGKTQQQISDNFKVSQGHVARVIKKVQGWKDREAEDKAAERAFRSNGAGKAAHRQARQMVRHCSFEKLLGGMAGELDAIITDPPYVPCRSTAGSPS